MAKEKEVVMFVVDRNQDLIRIDKFLFDKMPNVTRNKIKDGIKSGKVLVNKGPIKPSYKVKPLDNVEVSLDRKKRNNTVSSQHRYIVFSIYTQMRTKASRRRIHFNGHGGLWQTKVQRSNIQ